MAARYVEPIVSLVVGAGFPLSGRTLRAALARNPTLATTVQRFKIRQSTGS